MQDESRFTKAKGFVVPNPGPATTATENMINSIRPEDEARRNMASLRR